MNGKAKIGLTAGAVIGLLTFFQGIFDVRYTLKAEYSEVKTDIAVIKEKIQSISDNITEIKEILKEKKK